MFMKRNGISAGDVIPFRNRVWSGEGVVMPTKKRWLLTHDFALIWWSQVLSQVADGVSRLALL